MVLDGLNNENFPLEPGDHMRYIQKTFWGYRDDYHKRFCKKTPGNMITKLK